MWVPHSCLGDVKPIWRQHLLISSLLIIRSEDINKIKYGSTNKTHYTFVKENEQKVFSYIIQCIGIYP